jgi:hypothetical protein
VYGKFFGGLVNIHIANKRRVYDSVGKFNKFWHFVSIYIYFVIDWSNDSFDKYKNNVEFSNPDNTPRLPWIRYPRTKRCILIPQLIERIFGKIPAKMVFIDNC